MNTVQQIVESYFRFVRRCFTVSDVKVIRGNNRQIDLLALHKKSGECFHVEISVTHQLNWCKSLIKLEDEVARKFFGAPGSREGINPNTDYAKGKTYRDQISETYECYGISPSSVKRTVCIWHLSEAKANIETWLRAQEKKYGLRKGGMEVLLFRDEVIPKLLAKVKTSNYEDDVLRTFSLLRQYDDQTGRVRA